MFSTEYNEYRMSPMNSKKSWQMLISRGGWQITLACPLTLCAWYFVEHLGWFCASLYLMYYLNRCCVVWHSHYWKIIMNKIIHFLNKSFASLLLLLEEHIRMTHFTIWNYPKIMLVFKFLIEVELIILWAVFILYFLTLSSALTTM